VLHGCTVHDGALIGMHATVLNGAVMGPALWSLPPPSSLKGQRYPGLSGGRCAGQSSPPAHLGRDSALPVERFHVHRTHATAPRRSTCCC
jgi:hypothetical protein